MRTAECFVPYVTKKKKKRKVFDHVIAVDLAELGSRALFGWDVR